MRFVPHCQVFLIVSKNIELLLRLNKMLYAKNCLSFHNFVCFLYLCTELRMYFAYVNLLPNIRSERRRKSTSNLSKAGSLVEIRAG
jgi:hypothetical protein